MANEVSLYKLGFKQDWKVLSYALKNDSGFSIGENESAIELIQTAAENKIALVIASLVKKDDLIQIATFMKVYKQIAPDTLFKMVVVNFSGDKTYEKAIARLGILDVVDPLINVKALKFKIDFWMKGLTIQSKKQQQQLNSQIVSGSNQTNSRQASDKSFDEPKWVDPLDCPDDLWLISNKADCKKVLGKWLLKIKGPSPCVGQWVESGNTRNVWKFEFKEDERENFLDGNGEWFFRGDQKPDFIWKENLWMITGTNFNLFYQEGSEILSRLSLRDKILSICKNSEFARTKEEIIIASFDKEMVFRKDGFINTNEEVDSEGGTDRFKNLEGNGKTDHQNYDPLSGKGSAADNLSGSNLEMENKPGQNKINNRMYGPAGEKLREGQELGLENNQRNIETHYKNGNVKNNQDKNPENKYGPSGEQPREGSELGLKNDNNRVNKYYNNDLKDSESDRGGNYHGGIQEGNDGPEDYGGNSSTDKLSKYYNNKEKENQQSKPNVDLDKLSPLERERLEKKAKKEAIEAQEREIMKRKEKERREKLGKEKEAEKNSPNKAKKDNFKGMDSVDNDDYGGKSSTDKLSSHYSNKSSEKNKKADDQGKSDEWAKVIDEQRKKKTDARSRDGEEKGKNKLFDDEGAQNQQDFEDDAATFAAPAVLFGKGIDRKKDSKKDRKAQSQSEAKVVSLEDIKKQKEIENLVNAEQEDARELEEATESAEIVSILTQNDVHFQCRLDDYFDKKIIFTTNTPGIDTSSEVALDLSFRYLKKVARLNFKGTVSQLDDDSEGTKYISIEIGDENVKAFDSFMKLYQIRQKNIDFFIKKVKGY
jgi:hypothetical protein